MEASEMQKTIYDVMKLGRSNGMLHQLPDDTPLDGKHLKLGGREVLTFGSCSYLGLEMDPRIREGVRRAVDRWGTQFSSSRAYMSAPPYGELEEKLSTIFGGHTLSVSTTTLGHISCIPVICHEKDAILLDRMVHHSIQIAATQARSQGTHVELVRHGDWDTLEQRITELTAKHRNVWYMIDGIFSMFGDLPDVAEFRKLMDRHPNLWLYVDDAHGMSIAGTHGRGMHLSRMGWHERLVVATSLNKAFASGGGCITFQDPEMRDRVRLCGGPQTFSGPLQPPMLGAALASAAIHLSPEITTLQNELKEKIIHFNDALVNAGLPLYENNDTPIFFIKGGPLRFSYQLASRVAKEGYFLTVAQYPAVPLKRSGIRLSITRHHTKEELTALAQAMAHHYPKALEDVGLSADEVLREFNVDTESRERARVRKLTGLFDMSKPANAPLHSSQNEHVELTLETKTSASQLDAKEWDSLVGHRANFNHASLLGLERIFRNRPEAESNWGWHYFIVRAGGVPVAATFFTDALWKDDMLMRAEVSDHIERLRAKDPYLLTSRAFGMGTLLTEGNHLFLDRKGPWRQALAMIIDAASEAQRATGATSLVFRDLPEGDAELDAAFLEHGLVKMPMLAGHVVDLSTWKTEDEFFMTLGNRTRRRVRADVKDVENLFTQKLFTHAGHARPSDAEFEHFYGLYKKVKDRKRRLNTFDLPKDIVQQLWNTPGWEILSLHLSPEAGGPADGQAVAVGISFVEGDRMVAAICGLDGEQREVSVYRQLLWRMLKRAKELGVRHLELGMDAEREKQRLGAEPRPQCAYAQLTDHYSAEQLGQIAQAVALEEKKVA